MSSEMGLQMQSRVLTVLAILTASFAGGYMLVTPVDAAQLFNSTKSKSEESAQKRPEGGSATLFNKPHGNTNAMKTPYTSKSDSKKSRMAYRFPDGAEGMKVRNAFVKEQMARVSTSHIRVRGMAENRQLNYVEKSAHARMNDRTRYALQLEKERREDAHRRAEADRKLAALEMRQMQEDYDRSREEISRNKQDWETFKMERRQSKYGKQVDGALGNKAAFGSSAGSKSSSTTIERRSSGDSSKPRPVFNPVD